MAPGGKRKRNDRQSVDSGDTRPSPHRPVNPSLGQHERQADMREGGGRRSSRGGQGNQGGGRGRRNDNRNVSNSQNNLTIAARATPTPGPMSPPPRPSSATQTPAQTPTAISTNESMSMNWKPEPSPFDYAFLTDDRVSAWNITGRQEVVEAGIQARQDEDTMDLSAVFQEYIRAALDGRIDAGDAGNCVKEILGPDTAPADDIPGAFDPQTLFLDSLSMICESEDLKASTQQLRTFVFATSIPAVMMRQKLDAALLLNLGLTRDTFTRIGIRQATHLLYRQANYNLLREETEGYSKLVTELFTICGSEPPNSDLVEDAFEKVKGLIGTFDLDVGRVLDITLDVFAAVLIKHFRFFIKLLRVSSWWPRSGEIDSRSLTRCGGLPAWALPSFPGYLPTPEDEELAKQKRDARDKLFWERAREIGIEAFFELGGRELVDTEEKERLLKAESDAALDADRQWIKATGTYPPSGNRTAAQLLGFKLRFYASSARDNEDVLPANLIYLTALLIKIGFISLKDLYPHLWPLDEDMDAVRDAKMKEIEEKERAARGGTMNALMMAGALVDDTLPNGGKTRETTSKDDPAAKSSAEVDDKDKLDDPIDQKVQLLNCLLTIGAIPESLFILGQFPWLPEAYPELLDLIHRILNHSIQHVFDMSRPTPTVDPECLNKEIVDYDQSGMPKGSLRVIRLPPRKQLRWPFADKFDTNENNSYRFYWDEWADNVPVCQTVDDVFTLCGSLLNYSGVNIGKDHSLLSKLARIGTKSLSEDHSTQNLERWQDLLKRLLVPALSLTKANTSAVNEVYGMLRFYPIAIRYSIYAEWFEGQISRLPAMRAAFARTKAETTSTMKRISMTNLTSMARNLAKIAYASPGVVYSVALGQIEAYTNLTEVVVECAKYFTDLGYDVLVWSLLSSLGGKDRNRNDSEFALLPSKWLLALSRFSGKVFKRYSIMNLVPLIQYVNDQLHRGNATDLVILKELIAQMSGIVPDTDFNDAQLAAMTGGELLRRQTLINLQDKRYESVKTAKRLMRALTDTKLGGQLLLSIAQHRQSAIYTVPDDEAPIKLLATMVDDTQMILFQYLDLLRSNLSVEEFDSLVPGISELMKDFGLDPSLAFMIGRASVTHRLSRLSGLHLNGTTKTPPTDNNSPEVDNDGDVGMDTNEEATADSKTTLANGTSTPEEDVQMADAKNADSLSEVTSSEADPLLELLLPYMKTAEEVLPEGSWAFLTSEFYVLFWLTTLSDLAIPNHSYDAEISRLAKEQGDVMKDRTDMSRAGMAKKEETFKALVTTRENLIAEFRNQVGSFSGKKGRLLKRKNFWFKNVKHDLISDSILERCLLPRILLSPSDVDFCFRMIRFLHDNGTPNFRTLSLYSRLFRSNRLRSMIFTCTVREAENLGRFLRLVLTDLARWHSDRAIYEKEAWGPNQNLPGFAKAFDQDGNIKGLLAHDEKVGFKNILYSWHQKLNAALRDCLGGTEWMHIRNAMTILKSVVDVFPAVNFMGNNFVKQLETIATREKGVREDLSLAGNAILVQLKKKSKSWIMVQAFGYSLNDPAQGSNSPAPEVARPGVAISKTVLKATAPEFKPQSRASSMGVSTPKAPAITEVEDGEVDDAKSASTNIPKDNSTESSRTDTKTPSIQGGNDGKKSEILLRREKILRENAARSSTPTPPPSSIPPRPEIQRNVSSSHSLPNRPDVPLPSRQLLDRHPPRQDDRRDVRDNRIPDLVRDRGRDRAREFPPGDRRAIDAGPRDFRGGDRAPIAERDRSRPDSVPRWVGEPGRDNTDRASNGYRPVDNSGRLSRDNAMAPPKSTTIPERGLPINPERLPLVNPERQEMINPERAALISGGNESSRSDSPRRHREETRDRSSRQNSPPRRHGSERDPQDQRRDERSTRNASIDIHGSASRSRPDENQPPPAGPRGERPPDRNNDRAPPPDRSRDASNFQPTQQLPRSVDLDHGRLNRQQQQADPNFGRLNQSSDIPSGPRERNPRNNRIANAPQPRRDGRQPNGGATDVARPPTPDKQPPTGPSGGGRHPRRSASTSNTAPNSSGQFEAPPAAPSNLPPTPAAPSPTTAIHPDRLKHLGPQVTQSQPQSTTASTPATAGMHPDRLRSFGGPVATSNAPQQENTRSRPIAPPLQTQNPPLGPKSQNSPASQRMNGPPTGPASATERTSRGRNPNVINNINRMLEENSNKPAQGQERNPRGRRHGQAQTPVSGPSTPILPPPPPPPGPPPAQTRDTARDLVNPERADLIGNNTPSSEDRNRGDRDRSSRHDRSGRSRRSSPDRNRDQKRGPQEDGRPDRGDHRSRGSERSTRDTDRERHPRGEPSGGGRDLMGGSGSGSGREHRDRDSSRRDGRGAERDTHESGGGSGNWANGSDNRSERRSQRSERSDRSDDRGMRDRKRRSDGDGLREGGPEKRPRR